MCRVFFPVVLALFFNVLFELLEIGTFADAVHVGFLSMLCVSRFRSDFFSSFSRNCIRAPQQGLQAVFEWPCQVQMEGILFMILSFFRGSCDRGLPWLTAALKAKTCHRAETASIPLLSPVQLVCFFIRIQLISVGSPLREERHHSVLCIDLSTNSEV